MTSHPSFWIQMTHGFPHYYITSRWLKVTSPQCSYCHLRKRLSSHCGRCHRSLWQITRSRSSLCDRHGWTWWKDCTNSSFFDCKVKTVPTSLWLPYLPNYIIDGAHVFSDCTCLVRSLPYLSKAGQDKTPQELVDGIASEFQDTKPKTRWKYWRGTEIL